MGLIGLNQDDLTKILRQTYPKLTCLKYDDKLSQKLQQHLPKNENNL